MIIGKMNKVTKKKQKRSEHGKIYTGNKKKCITDQGDQ